MSFDGFWNLKSHHEGTKNTKWHEEKQEVDNRKCQLDGEMFFCAIHLRKYDHEKTYTNTELISLLFFFVFLRVLRAFVVRTNLLEIGA